MDGVEGAGSVGTISTCLHREKRNRVRTLHALAVESVPARQAVLGI